MKTRPAGTRSSSSSRISTRRRLSLLGSKKLNDGRRAWHTAGRSRARKGREHAHHGGGRIVGIRVRHLADGCADGIVAPHQWRLAMQRAAEGAEIIANRLRQLFGRQVGEVL